MRNPLAEQEPATLRRRGGVREPERGNLDSVGEEITPCYTGGVKEVKDPESSVAVEERKGSKIVEEPRRVCEEEKGGGRVQTRSSVPMQRCR